MFKYTRLICAATLLVVGGISSASAGVIGTQGFGGDGSPVINTPNIDTATVFTIGNWVTNLSQSGIFVGAPQYDIGTITFDKTVGTSFNFTNAGFGTFTSTSITESATGNGFENFIILGRFDHGTYGTANGPASLAVGFTQNGAAISDSGTLAVDASAIPEPSTFALLGLGGIGLAVRSAHRRLAAAV